jgi:hypothetical protein
MSSSVIIHAENIRSIIHDTVQSLDQRLPEGWKNLMLDPQTRSTSGIEVIDPQDVEKAMRHWGIDPILADNVLSDILRLIQQSNENNHYVAHLFTHHMENCSAGALSHCISTLLVIARPHEVDDEMDQLSTELIHVYIESGAETLEQKDYHECCGGCWFRQCCSICSKPRELTPGELYAVRRVLFSYQSLWVREHMSRIVKMWELDAMSILSDADNSLTP